MQSRNHTFKIITFFQGFTLLFFAVLILSLATGCSNLKPANLLPSYIDSNFLKLNPLPLQESRIEPGDFLSIIFAGKSVEVTAVLNSYGTTKVESLALGGAPNTIKGVEVDVDGKIELPLIGKIMVAGKTRSELKMMLAKEASKYLVDPIVYLGDLSQRISILGAVKNPITQDFKEAKINVFQLLASAGDVTEFAIMEKVKVYRDVNGVREMGTINLTDSSMFNSPYFYLRNNDMVYVPIQEEKFKLAKRTQILPLISLGVALFTVLLISVTTFIR